MAIPWARGPGNALGERGNAQGHEGNALASLAERTGPPRECARLFKGGSHRPPASRTDPLGGRAAAVPKDPRNTPCPKIRETPPAQRSAKRPKDPRSAPRPKIRETPPPARRRRTHRRRAQCGGRIAFAGEQHSMLFPCERNAPNAQGARARCVGAAPNALGREAPPLGGEGPMRWGAKRHRPGNPQCLLRRLAAGWARRRGEKSASSTW